MIPTQIPIRVAQPISIRWIGIRIESQPGLGAHVNTAYVWSFLVGTTTNMTLVFDSNIKHWSLSATLIAHCQMLHIVIVVVVEALGVLLHEIVEALKNTGIVAIWS